MLAIATRAESGTSHARPEVMGVLGDEVRVARTDGMAGVTDRIRARRSLARAERRLRGHRAPPRYPVQCDGRGQGRAYALVA